MFQWGSHNSQFPAVISLVFLSCAFLYVYVFLVVCFNVEDNKISCGGGMRTVLLVFHRAEQLKRLPPDPRSAQRKSFWPCFQTIWRYIRKSTSHSLLLTEAAWEKPALRRLHLRPSFVQSVLQGIVGKGENLGKLGPSPKVDNPNQLVLARSSRLGSCHWVLGVGAQFVRRGLEDRQEFQILIFGSKCPPTTATTITAITTTIFFFTTITIAFTTSKQHSPLKRWKETKKDNRVNR